MYLPFRLFLIGVLLLVVVGVAGFSPENVPLDASDEHRLDLETVESNFLCDITFRGRHGGATDEITIDFRESQVRTRVGWWAAIARGRGEWGRDGPDPETVTLRPGDTFERDYSLTFGCNARRRYRFHISADGNEHTFTYPAEDEFTQQTLIDLGDVSRFFPWIEPGAGPVAGAPANIDGVSLEGIWMRKESAFDPNDGMLLEIQGDRAVITSVPSTALAAWTVGKVIWQGITDEGEVEILGHNNNYYAGEITMDGSLRLQVDVFRGGSGSEQTWIREYADCVGNIIQIDPMVAAVVDPIVESEITEQELVGIAVGVIRNGQIVHLKGYGYADRENGIPVTEETLFRWASISKTVTAVAAMRMWEDEYLDLTADVSELVPEYQDKPDGVITMTQLLSHTAGVEAYPDGWYGRAQNLPNDSVYDPIAALAVLDDSLLFAPGDSSSYSTMGFMLAGAVLDRVAQSDYGYPSASFSSAFEQFVQEEIADPLCMTTLQTDFPLERSPLEPRRYQKNENNIVYQVEGDTDEIIHWRLPGGGYQSNIRDLALFANGLLNQSILGANGYNMLTTEILTSSGDSTGYAQGLDVTYGSSGTTIRLGHGGSQKGVRTSMYLYPTRDIAVVFLSNSSHTNRSRIRNRIVNAVASWTWTVGDYDLRDHVDCDSTDQVNSGNRFAGVWHPGATGDQVIRRGYTRGLFTRERTRLAEEGYHLTDIESFTKADGMRLWDGVFTEGAPRTLLRRDENTQSFHDRWEEWSNDGWRLIDLETYKSRSGERRWDGVFVRGSGRYALWRNFTTDEFHDKWEESSNDGLRLIDIETYAGNDGRRLWSGVFREGTGGYALYRNLTRSEFGDQWSQLQDQGMRLIDIESYFGNSGQRLWAGVWRSDNGTDRLNRDMRFCGTWNQHSGFWDKHLQWTAEGYELADFERYTDTP